MEQKHIFHTHCCCKCVIRNIRGYYFPLIQLQKALKKKKKQACSGKNSSVILPINFLPVTIQIVLNGSLCVLPQTHTLQGLHRGTLEQKETSQTRIELLATLLRRHLSFPTSYFLTRSDIPRAYQGTLSIALENDAAFSVHQLGLDGNLVEIYKQNF